VRYSALVIGLGQIGMGYDYAASPGEMIATHAQALEFHDGFHLMGGLDADENARKRFTDKFGKPAFSHRSDAFSKLNPDVVVIAVPTEFHQPVFEDVTNHFTPRMIILEKPLSYNIAEAKKIMDVGLSRNLPVAVNYFREYEPTYREIAKKIKSGLLEFPLKIVVHYTKGILNNGSHFLQYISNFMGDFQSLDIISPGRLWAEKDPEPDLCIQFDNGEAYFIAHREENYSFYEMDIIGPDGKLSFSNLGSRIENYKVVDDHEFKGYRVLSETPEQYYPDLKKYQLHVYDNIFNYFSGEEELLCDLHTLKQTVSIYEKLEKVLSSV